MSPTLRATAGRGRGRGGRYHGRVTAVEPDPTDDEAGELVEHDARQTGTQATSLSKAQEAQTKHGGTEMGDVGAVLPELKRPP